MKNVIALLLLALPINVFAGNDDLAASKIPPALLKNAHAVERFNNLDVIVETPESVIIKEHYAITILDRQGDEYARCFAPFSKLEKLQSVSGYIYDKSGKQIEKLRESDFRLLSNWSQAEYSDNKVKAYIATYREYPYTVEFSVETKQLHSFALPYWSVQEHNDCAIEKGTMIITTPKDFKIRYTSLNGKYTPDIREEKDHMVYTWSATNIPAFANEPMGDEYYGGMPVVLVAPVDFKMLDYSGNMKDWKSMGAFLYQLNKDRATLTADKKEKVKQLTAGVKDPREIIRILYSYMQENTRYVLVTYGIGGWQTIDAASTCNNQYGDCKGLSNYMMALLKDAGIPSNMVIIYGGRDRLRPMLADFPSAQAFNHVILAVPLANDTVWLECTSRDHPAGYLGSFTSDRDALMLTAEGGVVVHTPKYDSSVNKASHFAKGICTEDGSIAFSLKDYYSGLMAEQLLGIDELNDQQKDQVINRKFELGSYTAAGYKTVRNDHGAIPGMEETVNITANNMVSKAGNYKLVSMDLVPLNMSVDMQLIERKKDFVLRNAYSVSDSFELAIPAGAEVSALPDPVISETPFGSFRLNIVQKEDSLIAVRRIVRRKGRFAPADYAKYEEWVDNINNSSHYKVVLKNK